MANDYLIKTEKLIPFLHIDDQELFVLPDLEVVIIVGDLVVDDGCPVFEVLRADDALDVAVDDLLADDVLVEDVLVDDVLVDDVEFDFLTFG